MATGDNTLTAISVGSSCNILRDGQLVFYGDLNEHNQVVWKNSKLLIHPEQDTDYQEGDDFNHQENSCADFDNETSLIVSNPCMDVPWDHHSNNDYGVAISGKLLNFLNQNRK